MEPKNEHEKVLEELLCCVSPQRREEFLQIEAGVRLPELYYDIPFKRIFDADIHKDRLTKLFQLIFNEDVFVESSLNSETSKASIYFKKTIRDIMASLSNQGIVNLEMQMAAQEFIVQRMDVYASDMIMLQYSILKSESKSDMDFSKIKQSYCVVLMKESPKLFRDNQSYIHYKESCTNTGIVLPDLSKIVYIELDKCLQQVRNGSYPEEKGELSMILTFLADINGETAALEKFCQQAEESDVGQDIVTMKEEIKEELRLMAMDRKELCQMLNEKYEADIRYSEKMQAIREGKAEGKAEGKVEGKAEDILELLEDHGNVPEILHDRIMSQRDLPTLRKWVKLAGKAKSIEAFTQEIKDS